MDKKSSPQLNRPHYYGKVGDVHVFHATHKDHHAMVGIHIENPDDDKLNSALDEARSKGMKSVVIHGTPPEGFRTKIHGDLGVHKPGKLKKSEVAPVVISTALQKTLLQPDKQTKSDIVAHTNSLESTPMSLIEWGAKKLASLPKDSVESFELDNRIIKVRKNDADLYSGWIETKDGQISHQFEKITLPELMAQLQSKLELYGREEEVVNEETKEPATLEQVQAKLLALKNKVKSLMDGAGLDVDDEEETETTPKADPRFVEDEAQPDENGEIKMEIPTKDLVPGMLNPEKVCPACEQKSEKCMCFMNMDKPRLEFDGRKVTIFFKSEVWDMESREAFADDFKRRAGRLLHKKFS